jgi:DNA mismatch endonuclease (patch repair protein)
MANVKGRNTSPERLVRLCLRRLRCRYRSNVETIDGTPDIVLTGRKKLIFVNGCFWHGHAGCGRATRPQTNRAFWKRKIEGNIRRDARLFRKLRKAGWSVLVVWQCQTKDATRLERRLSRFIGR